MKNVYIIHNSLYGNSRILAEEIAKGLTKKFDVKVKRIGNFNLTNDTDNLYGLILTTRIMQFGVDREMKKFVEEIDTNRKGPIPKTIICYTHRLKPKKLFKRGMVKTIRNAKNIENVYSEVLEVKMKSMKGPAEEGQEQKIQDFINNIKVYLED